MSEALTQTEQSNPNRNKKSIYDFSFSSVTFRYSQVGPKDKQQKHISLFDSY